MRPTAAGLPAMVCAAYVLLGCVVTWPLPIHARTHLLGSTSGDLGVYVWNLWIFRHEILRHAHAPFWTEHVFALTGGADFATHNYAPIAGLAGAPLIGVLGVVGAFNTVLIVSIALAGLGVYVLARQLGVRPAAAWMGGALFMASPVMTARETAHFSLVLAAPLPLFLWALWRTLDSGRVRDAVLTGALVAVASYSDVYYGVYCGMMGGFAVVARFVTVAAIKRPRPSRPWARRAVMTVAAVALAAIVWPIASGATSLRIGPVVIGLETFYTPMLALVMLAALRLAMGFTLTFRLHDRPDRLIRLGLVAIAMCLALMVPLLVGLGMRYASGRLPSIDTFWRSSPRGVDLLAYVVPNPNHPWFGSFTREWFMPDDPNAFPELIAAFPLLACIALAVAAWRRVLPRFWVAFTAVFVALSLGPFVHIAGLNTQVIGPWALLRYVPVIGLARSPARFAIVATLGLAILCAFGCEYLLEHVRRTRVRTVGVGVLTAALALELAPGRPLYSAAVPDVYARIATTDESTGRLLDLPTGLRDGTSSLGNFNASSQYFQTAHRRQLVGGYLSRVSSWRKEQNQGNPMMHALLALSEGKVPRADAREAAFRFRDTFLRQSCVRFVVVDKQQASEALRLFAVDALDLSLIHEDNAYALFTPNRQPACLP